MLQEALRGVNQLAAGDRKLNAFCADDSFALFCGSLGARDVLRGAGHNPAEIIKKVADLVLTSVPNTLCCPSRDIAARHGGCSSWLEPSRPDNEKSPNK